MGLRRREKKEEDPRRPHIDAARTAGRPREGTRGRAVHRHAPPATGGGSSLVWCIDFLFFLDEAVHGQRYQALLKLHKHTGCSGYY